MNTIDELWAKIAEPHGAANLSDAEIDLIIKDQRKRLSMYESGVRPAKVDQSEQVQNVLESLIKSRSKEKVAAKPAKGFRRF